MRFEVPKIKDARFAQELMQMLSDSMSELRTEAGKWPDQMTFGGSLGKEVFDFIQEKGWDLAKFGPSHAGPVNQVTFYYSKPIDQIEDRGATIFDEGFNNRKINGIPGPETVQKILGAYSAPAFRIERQVRPKLQVKLFRLT